jgi:hypothetical protein
MQLNRIPEPQRRRIFRALVQAQDQGIGVYRSRLRMSVRFGITRCQVEHIEEEGLNNDWPPLSGPAEPPDCEGELCFDEPEPAITTDTRAEQTCLGSESLS